MFRAAAAVNALTLAVILYFLVKNGSSAINWEFLTSPPKNSMTQGGILPCVLGTVYLGTGALVVAMPLGTACAIYLKEYARQGVMVRIIRFAINNLADHIQGGPACGLSLNDHRRDSVFEQGCGGNLALNVYGSRIFQQAASGLNFESCHGPSLSHLHSCHLGHQNLANKAHPVRQRPGAHSAGSGHELGCNHLPGKAAQESVKCLANRFAMADFQCYGSSNFMKKALTEVQGSGISKKKMQKTFRRKNMAKRISGGLLACVLLVFMASSASAVTVDFHGKAMAGVLSSSNSYLLGGDDSDSATIGVGKFRFRTEVGTDDEMVKMVYGFETGANNFGDTETDPAGESGWGYSGDSVDFENRFAYIQTAIPGFDDTMFGRAGLQKTGVNHWLWTETAAGVTLHGKGEVNWQAGWFRGYEENWGEDGSQDTDLYTVRADFSPASNITMGGFGVYAFDFGDEKDFARDADQYWLGATGSLDGPVFISGDLIYQGGDAEVGGTDDVSAYLVNATMGTELTDRTRVSFNALYVSGDDDPNDGDQEAFQSIDADVKVGQIFFKDSLAASMDRFVDDMFGQKQSYEEMENNGLFNLAVEGEVQVDAKNNLRGAVRYMETAEEYQGDDELGVELDLWYSHKLNDNLTLKLEGAYLLSGDLAEEMFETDNDVYQVGAGMVFAF